MDGLFVRHVANLSKVRQERVVAGATQSRSRTLAHAAGCSFGAVQAGLMAYQRSSYVAAAMLSSGGL
jgi:hypothetical protein